MKTIEKLNKELYNASINNNLETIKYLVEKGATDLNEALHNASENNNLEIVKYLVEKGATDLNPALVYASENNNLEMVKYVVEKGATEDLDLALYFASENNNLEMVNYLKSVINSKENNKNASSNWFQKIYKNSQLESLPNMYAIMKANNKFDVLKCKKEDIGYKCMTTTYQENSVEEALENANDRIKFMEP